MANNNILALFSVQHDRLIELLPNGRAATPITFVAHNRLKATQWMIEQMSRRNVTVEVGDAPIWAFLEKPPSRTDNAWGARPPTRDESMLRLEVPRSRCLLSWHFPWAYQILHDFNSGDDCLMQPSYIFSGNSEREFYNCRKPPEADCFRSRQKIFDLNLGSTEDFSWWHPASGDEPKDITYRLQATLPFVLPSDVIDVSKDW